MIKLNLFYQKFLVRIQMKIIKFKKMQKMRRINLKIEIIDIKFLTNKSINNNYYFSNL